MYNFAVADVPRLHGSKLEPRNNYQADYLYYSDISYISTIKYQSVHVHELTLTAVRSITALVIMDFLTIYL